MTATTDKLTVAQAKALASATDEWQPLPADVRPATAQ